MVDAACPCCTPWSMLRGRGEEAIYVGGSENFPGTSYAVVWKFTETGTRTRLYPAAVTTLTGRVYDLDADRNGNCYFVRYLATSSADDVYKVDSSGTLLWSHLISGTNRCDSIAVSNDGWVYVYDNTSGKIFKLSGEDGTEQAGNWPVTVSYVVAELCVDRSGNIYAGGAGNKLTSYAPDGTQNWTTVLYYSTETHTQTVNGLSLTLDNSVLSAVSLSDTSHSCWYEVDPLTGDFTAHANPGTLSGLYATDYALDDTRYFSGDNNLAIYKNGVISPAFYSPPKTTRSIAVGMYGDVYTAQDKPTSGTKNDVLKIDTGGTLTWGYVMASSELAWRAVLATGRHGCWGP